ncbi:PfkB family carbohydrate kinase [Microbispora hainanensis]|uniref:PfkB family carbohydrate kinase n=1 Tax=Microbispora hainanensis TaxID=568844 RepID=A0ABZ1SPQ5_9ACTN|nr:PfkB family carbohydrate kinase [Microbispora hainanensis]
MSGPLVIVGDSLLDVDVEGTADRLCPDAPVPVVEGQAEHHRPGGAGLAALLAARDGTRVVLITALGDDPSGRCLEDLLSPMVEIVRLPLRGTTVRKSRVRARGQTLVRIDTGDGRAMGRPGQVASASAFARAAGALAAASAVLVADYGRGVADLLREPLRGLDVPLVWDPHPRGSLPVPGCALVTPSEAEARGMCEEPYVSPERTARRLVRDLGAEAVAITLGERGAMLARRGGRFGPVPAPHVASGTDACGAGDRFAAAAALALADGASSEDAVARAVGEATRFVEEGGAAALRLHHSGRYRSGRYRSGQDHSGQDHSGQDHSGQDHSGQYRSGRHCPATEPPVPFGPGASAFDVAGAVRAAGGRLIATGGCFDLLHAGHVSLLRRARALGDALVVCVNSDDSIRRLKGPGRPLVSERDRVEVLRALGCVDAVTVFDEDTPSQVIERLCPDVWVKGGDYDERSMPEAEAVRRTGGEIVILPTVPGYSTTDLIAAARAAS